MILVVVQVASRYALSEVQQRRRRRGPPSEPLASPGRMGMGLLETWECSHETCFERGSARSLTHAGAGTGAGADGHGYLLVQRLKTVSGGAPMVLVLSLLVRWTRCAVVVWKKE